MPQAHGDEEELDPERRAREEARAQMVKVLVSTNTSSTSEFTAKKAVSSAALK